MNGNEHVRKNRRWLIALAAVAFVFVAYLVIWNLPSARFFRMEVSAVNLLEPPTGTVADCGDQGRDIPVDDYYCCDCQGTEMVELHFDEPLGQGFTVCSACEAACQEEFGAGVAEGKSLGGQC